MNPKIERQFKQLEKLKNMFEQKVKGLSSEKINKKPKGDNWSIGQVYYHLFLVEEGTYKYLTEKTKEINSITDSGLKSWYRTTLLKLFLWFPFKFKAPRTVSDSIPDEIDFDSLMTDWNLLREKISLLLHAQEERHLKRKIFKHPRIGYINFYQTIEFIESHHRHHIKQINDLLSNK
jgi:hypothetical protein